MVKVELTSKEASILMQVLWHTEKTIEMMFLAGENCLNERLEVKALQEKLSDSIINSPEFQQFFDGIEQKVQSEQELINYAKNLINGVNNDNLQ